MAAAAVAQLAGKLMTVAGIVGGVGGAVFSFLMSLEPIQREIRFLSNSVWPNAEIGIQDAVFLYRINVISREQFLDILKKYGFSEDKAELILKAAREIISPGDAIAAWRRGIISEQEMRNYLRGHGYTDRDIEILIKVSEAFPSASDIVRFAVREVFTPEIAEKFGQYEDLPQQFIELAKKAGLSEEFARWYWAAHWELPSITQAFEMFHRKIITKDELELLLRAHDVMPFWREKLIQLSYILPTRVDLRRMYELSMITESELREYYEKLGYSPEDAAKLTEWTKAEYNAEQRGLTVSLLEKAVKTGIISLEQYKEYLKALAMPEDNIELRATLLEAELAIEEAKAAFEDLVNAFANGEITYEEFVEKAHQLPLSAAYINREIAKAYRRYMVRRKLPSLSDVRRWLRLGLIDKDRYAEYLRRLGYGDAEISLYVKELELTHGGGTEGA